MGFRLHLSPMLAVATGAIFLAGLIAAPAMTGKVGAAASTRRYSHDHFRSHARPWKQWHRERDYLDRSSDRRHHARDRHPPKAWKQHRHPAHSQQPIASCIQKARVWSNRDRAGRRHLAKHCRRSQPRRPVHGAPAPLRPTQPASQATEPAQPPSLRQPAATSPHEPADVTGVTPTPMPGSPTTVCEPTTTSIRVTTTTTTQAPTTSGTSTTTTTRAPTTSGTTTTTTTRAPTTSGTTTTVEPTTETTPRQPPTTQTSSAGGQSPGPSYVPNPANSSDPSAQTVTTATVKPPSYSFQPAGPTGTSAPTTTMQASTIAQPTTSTVCEPTGGGRLSSTGSAVLPLLAAVVALFAGGFSVLLMARNRPAE